MAHAILFACDPLIRRQLIIKFDELLKLICFIEHSFRFETTSFGFLIVTASLIFSSVSESKSEYATWFCDHQEMRLHPRGIHTPEYLRSQSPPLYSPSWHPKEWPSPFVLAELALCITSILLFLGLAPPSSVLAELAVLEGALPLLVLAELAAAYCPWEGGVMFFYIRNNRGIIFFS